MADTAFCRICRGTMAVKAYHDKLQAECNSCHSRIDLPPRATLRYEEAAENDIMVSSRRIKKNAQDPVNKKVNITCPKCSYHLGRIMMVGDMKTIYTCINCNYAWSL